MLHSSFAGFEETYFLSYARSSLRREGLLRSVQPGKMFVRSPHGLLLSAGCPMISNCTFIWIQIAHISLDLHLTRITTRDLLTPLQRLNAPISHSSEHLATWPLQASRSASSSSCTMIDELLAKSFRPSYSRVPFSHLCWGLLSISVRIVP